MNAGSMAWPMPLRRWLVGLMVLHVVAASLVIAGREPVLAVSENGRAIAEMTDFRRDLPKPCQKIVLPGPVNTCPLSSFSLNFIPIRGVEHEVPAWAAAAERRLSDSSLPAQCSGLAPYRPPCFEAPTRA